MENHLKKQLGEVLIRAYVPYREKAIKLAKHHSGAQSQEDVFKLVDTVIDNHLKEMINSVIAKLENENKKPFSVQEKSEFLNEIKKILREEEVRLRSNK